MPLIGRVRSFGLSTCMRTLSFCCHSAPFCNSTPTTDRLRRLQLGDEQRAAGHQAEHAQSQTQYNSDLGPNALTDAPPSRTTTSRRMVTKRHIIDMTQARP